MTKRYARFGAELGDGRPLFPYGSLAELTPNIEAGDQVFLAGEFPEQLSLDQLDGVQVMQWDGEPQAVLRGDTVIPPASWIQFAGDVYIASAPGGVTVTRVLWNWESRVLPSGQHYADLRPGVFGALNPGEWAQLGTTIQIHIDTTAGMVAPTDTADVYAYTRGDAGNIDGLVIGRSTDPLVDGVHSYLWSDNIAAADGYGVKMSNCTNPVIRNTRVIECGAHSIGCVNDSGSNPRAMGTALMEKATCVGMHGGGGGSQNHAVFFANEASGMSGVRGRDMRLDLYGTLDYEQQPLDPTRNIVGTFQHGSAGSVITDLEWERILAIGYSGHLSAAHGQGACDHTTVLLANEDDKTAYPVRYIDCLGPNTTAMKFNSGGGAHFVFERCFYDFARAAEEGLKQVAAGEAQDFIVGEQSAAPSGPSRVLAISSAFIFDLRRLFDTNGDLVGDAGIRFREVDGSVHTLGQQIGLFGETSFVPHNCAFACRMNASSIGEETFRMWYDHTRRRAIDCQFVSVLPHDLARGGAEALANIQDSSGNLYFNVRNYSSSGGTPDDWDTEAEYQASVEPDSFFEEDPGLANLTNTMKTLADLFPVAGGWIRENPQFRVGGLQPRGINGRSYSGHIGPFQFGARVGGNPRARGPMSILAIGD